MSIAFVQLYTYTWNYPFPHSCNISNSLATIHHISSASQQKAQLLLVPRECVPFEISMSIKQNIYIFFTITVHSYDHNLLSFLVTRICIRAFQASQVFTSKLEATYKHVFPSTCV